MKDSIKITIISLFVILQLLLFVGCEAQVPLTEDVVKHVNQTASDLVISTTEQSSLKAETSDIPIIQPEVQSLDDWMVDGDEFNAGCSWYCAGEVQSVTSSSELKGNNTVSYSGSMAHDWDLSTVWVEGNSEYGIGENLDYVIAGSDFNLTVDNVILINGYIKSDSLWKQNSRVKTLKLYVDNELYAILDVKDTKEVQVFSFKEIPLKGIASVNVKLEIADVYKGEKFKDTAITELEFGGTGHH